MVFVGFLFLLPMTLSHAFIAYLVWGWTALISIDSYLYGFMTGLRLNFMFGLIAIAMIVFRNKGDWHGYKDNRMFLFITVFVIQGTLSAIFAYDNNSLNWDLYDRFIKGILFVLLMPAVVYGRYRIHALIVTICLGLAFHGVIDGLKFIVSGGGHKVYGLIKFGDNNHFAVILSMCLPLLLYLSRYFENKLARFGALAGSLCVIAAVIGTHSRGGALCLLVGAMVFAMTSRKKMFGFSIIAVAMALVIVFAPSSWGERMETVKSAGEESSLLTRIEAWQVSSAIALKNPLLGGGLHAIQAHDVWNQFKGSQGLLGFIDTGPPTDHPWAAHSIYFEIMGDFGFLGLTIFLTLLIRSLKNCVTIIQITKKYGADFVWANDLSRSLMAVLAILLSGGALVSIAYTEIIYVVMMLTELLRREMHAKKAPSTNDNVAKLNAFD